MSFYERLEQIYKDELKTALKGMYESGGTNMDTYDFHARQGHEMLKELSMMIPIDEFAVLKQQYYCAIYDGEWDDATETESEEN